MQKYLKSYADKSFYTAILFAGVMNAPTGFELIPTVKMALMFGMLYWIGMSFVVMWIDKIKTKNLDNGKTIEPIQTRNVPLILSSTEAYDKCLEILDTMKANIKSQDAIFMEIKASLNQKWSFCEELIDIKIVQNGIDSSLFIKAYPADVTLTFDFGASWRNVESFCKTLQSQTKDTRI